MNNRKAKQLSRISKAALSHVPNGYDQLKELYKALPSKARGRASRMMKHLTASKQIKKTKAAIFCVSILHSAILYQDASPRIKPRPQKQSWNIL